jgi:hypothetical protein
VLVPPVPSTMIRMYSSCAKSLAGREIEGPRWVNTCGSLNGKGTSSEYSMLYAQLIISECMFSYDLEHATWEGEASLGDRVAYFIKTFNLDLLDAGVENDPDTNVLLPGYEDKLPDELLAGF